MNEAVPILGAKKKPCELCGRPAHPFTTRCAYNDLTSRIKNLLNKNAMVPELVRQNKELMQTALTFQTQFDNMALTIGLFEETVKEFQNGETIWLRFQEKLEEKWPKTTSQGTEENPSPSSPKSTIPNETESNPCTAETTPGETIASASSPKIQIVTPVGNGPRS